MIEPGTIGLDPKETLEVLEELVAEILTPEEQETFRRLMAKIEAVVIEMNRQDRDRWAAMDREKAFSCP